MTKQLLALKRIRKRLILEKEVYLDTVWRERRVMALWQSPFLVSMRHAFQDDDVLYIAMDFYSGGDLRYFLSTRGVMEESVCRYYAAEMVLALAELRQHDVVYRDLKPDNVLLDGDGHLAMSDFGLAVMLQGENGHEKIGGAAGTPGYLAPEVLRGDLYDTAVDLYSFGITLFELMEKKRPYASKSATMRAEPAVFRSGVSDAGKSFIRGLLLKNPDERLGSRSVDDLKKHEWFAGVDWDAMEARTVPPPFKPAANTTNFEGLLELEEQFFVSVDASEAPLTEAQQAHFVGFEWNTALVPADTPTAPTSGADIAMDEKQATGGAASAGCSVSPAKGDGEAAGEPRVAAA